MCTMTATLIRARPQTPLQPAALAFLAVPFDVLRWHFAAAVLSGVAPRSIVASGQLERTLDTLERLILGPLARRR
jgi:hypothetical protein